MEKRIHSKTIKKEKKRERRGEGNSPRSTTTTTTTAAMDSFKDDKLKSEDVKYLVSTHGSRGGEADPHPTQSCASGVGVPHNNTHNCGPVPSSFLTARSRFYLTAGPPTAGRPQNQGPHDRPVQRPSHSQASEPRRPPAGVPDGEEVRQGGSRELLGSRGRANVV